jgi:putative FmdB family regulatory protein
LNGFEFSFIVIFGISMPIYAYRCEACGFAKDVLQKISDEPLTDCPSCGQAQFTKQITAAGFQLKGSGWYVTDFRGGANGSTGSATSSSSATNSSNSTNSTSSSSNTTSESSNAASSTGNSAGNSVA